MFEGVVGNGYQGDIAIDDIAVKSGACSSPGKNVINLSPNIIISLYTCIFHLAVVQNHSYSYTVLVTSFIMLSEFSRIRRLWVTDGYFTRDI